MNPRPTLKLLEGKVFGNLTVIKRNGNDIKGDALWMVQCKCGNVVTKKSGVLTRGGAKSCGHKCSLKREYIKNSLIGQRYGSLLVIGYAGKDDDGKNHWECRCDCGRVIIRIVANIKKSGRCYSRCPLSSNQNSDNSSNKVNKLNE